MVDNWRRWDIRRMEEDLWGVIIRVIYGDVSNNVRDNNEKGRIKVKIKEWWRKMEKKLGMGDVNRRISEGDDIRSGGWKCD